MCCRSQGGLIQSSSGRVNPAGTGRRHSDTGERVQKPCIQAKTAQMFLEYQMRDEVRPRLHATIQPANYYVATPYGRRAHQKVKNLANYYKDCAEWSETQEFYSNVCVLFLLFLLTCCRFKYFSLPRPPYVFTCCGRMCPRPHHTYFYIYVHHYKDGFLSMTIFHSYLATSLNIF